MHPRGRLRDLILGHDNPWAATFDARRALTSLPGKEFVKHNIHVGKTWLKDRLMACNVEWNGGEKSWDCRRRARDLPRATGRSPAYGTRGVSERDEQEEQCQRALA